MAHCSRAACGRWRPNLLAHRGRTGCVLDAEWFCSAPCLEQAVRDRLRGEGRALGGRPAPIPPPKVGMLLVHQRVISAADLRRALEAQRRSGLPLGRQIQRLGLASSAEVLRALAAQAAVGYLTTLDPASLRPEAGPLSRGTVRALGLVPFEVDPARRRLKVAAIAPLPQLSLRAMRELTGWHIEPFLVGDDQWPAILEAFSPTADGTRDRVRAIEVPDIVDAAARVARAVATSRVARMSHARCDPFMWVRVEARERIEDLLVTDQHRERQAWQAAHT